MKLLSLLLILGLTQALPVSENCTGVIVKNSQYLYEQEVLKTELDRPYLLAIHRNRDTLYFSYSVEGKDEEFKTAKIDLKTNKFQDINGVKNGFAQYVDNDDDEVYIGGGDGIYKYDPESDSVQLYAANNSDIWTIFEKDDVLYYAEFPSQFLNKFEDGETEKFKDLEDTKVDMFVIDKDDVIFYSNNTGLYAQKKGTKDAECYMPFEESSVRGLTLDKNGLVYACMSDGIYVVDKTEKNFDKVVEIEDAFGVAFDKKNNIIYSDANNLYRLKPNKDLKC